MISLTVISLLVSAGVGIATPTPTPTGRPLPLVIWHGLGDTYDSDGIQSVGNLAQKLHPGTFVHSIYLDPDPDSDRSATFFGQVNTQISTVCEQLSSIPELTSGFNAVGFSQGGQFLRAYIQRCNTPPVRTLITFGSQHNGISDFLAECRPTDFVCRTASSALQSSKWTSWVQNRVVPAQYFRDPEDLEAYLEYSAFLADINNERPNERNATYARNLALLEKFVMIMFEEDTTVVPKESAWFAEFNKTTGKRTLLEDRELYKQDWIGLKKLGKEKKLDFLTAPGRHMELSEELLTGLFEKYLGGRVVMDGEKVGLRVQGVEL
ncbi:alpha/beta-hydrolase [Choiromyces venosus 120613-1]|uniref:Palmitoyl-protein thioesterase 1 n=1 Tax=Choiromyces venosus 120613-1 TaxID=1336337 RepID=A0A3N4JP20_9PEZI|nr:alpha/beta-hydrolase [Choiromyces venosus 120613-1]